MGVRSMQGTLGCTMLAPAAREYAVLPVGVAMMIPVQGKITPDHIYSIGDEVQCYDTPVRVLSDFSVLGGRGVDTVHVLQA